MDANVHTTIGAIFAGCLTAVGLSAILGFQTFLYFQIFPSDALRYKLLVAWIWFTDAIHTVLICVSVWWYVVENFLDLGRTAINFPTIAITVLLTGIITLSVNTFYGWRIHKLSKRNWWLTGPIALLSTARLCLAIVSTTGMIMTETFPRFAEHFKIVFTAGLMLSALTDVFISCTRYYYLRTLNDGYSSTQEMVDAVLVFTINDGMLTCAVVIVTVVCVSLGMIIPSLSSKALSKWLTMSSNLVYLGIYFTISKLYSNSVLATLNLRNWYRHRYTWPRPHGRSILGSGGSDGARTNEMPMANRRLSNLPAQKLPLPSDHETSRMEVFIDRQVEYTVSELIEELDHDSGSHSPSAKAGEISVG